MVNHDGVEHAGYLSFLVLLAFFPFLVFFVAILGALGETSAGSHLIHLIVDNAPQHMVAAIVPRIDEILSGPPQGLLTISILGTIWTSSSIVEGMRTVLNRAYHVHTPPNYYLRRALSIGQLLLLTLILIVAMLALVIVPIVFNKLFGVFITYQTINGQSQEALPQVSFFAGEWELLRYVFAFAVLLFFISGLYYFLPNVKQKWRDTIPGALITLIGWAIAARGITYYLSHYNQFNLVYGSLASMIAFLVFFYIINMIFIYGAEFNYLLEQYLGHKIIQRQEVSPEQVKTGELHNRDVKKDEIVVRDDKR